MAVFSVIVIVYQFFRRTPAFFQMKVLNKMNGNCLHWMHPNSYTGACIFFNVAPKKTGPSDTPFKFHLPSGIKRSVMLSTYLVWFLYGKKTFNDKAC